MRWLTRCRHCTHHAVTIPTTAAGDVEELERQMICTDPDTPRGDA
jgi:hypothetical protein